MNAALQCLSNIEALTSFFLECSHYIKATTAHRQQQSSRGNASGSQLTQQSLAMTYVRLMKDIWQRPSKASKQVVSSIAPVDLIRVIKLAQPMFRGCQQHDSMELLTYLLDQMHEELKRPLPPVAAIRPPQSPLSSSSSRLHSFPVRIIFNYFYSPSDYSYDHQINFDVVLDFVLVLNSMRKFTNKYDSLLFLFYNKVQFYN